MTIETDIVKAPQHEKNQLTPSERFVNKLIEKLSVGNLEVKLTEFQKRLAQSYMSGINKAIITAEKGRYAPKNDLAYSWNTIKIDDELADTIISYARCGLDPMQPNHLSPVLYKDNKAGLYTVSFIPGYRGRELKAKKYAIDPPDHVIVELVYSTDKFKSIKKDRNNSYESYEFEVVNEFDRGTVIGGFWYHIYSNNPEKNRLVVMSKKEIDKRKPDKAAAEFWGGEKDVWKDNKKVGKEQVDGWYEKMAWKTLFHDAWKAVTIDPQKIDDDYYKMQSAEIEATENIIEAEIAENANKDIIDIEPSEVVEVDNTVPNQTNIEHVQQTISEGPGY